MYTDQIYFDDFLSQIEQEIVLKNRSENLKKQREIDRLLERKLYLESLIEAGGEYVADGDDGDVMWDYFTKDELDRWREEIKLLESQINNLKYD
jgi:hypothetical protein